jgi:hypothetical protein
VVKISDIHLEVLRDDLLRNMGEPVCHLEDVIRRIEDKKCDEMGSTWNVVVSLKSPSGNTYGQQNHEVQT